MELKLIPVLNIEITFAFSLLNKDKGFTGTLNFKTVANRLNDSLVTVSADNAFYNALFDGLFDKQLNEKDEIQYNSLFERVSGLEVTIENTETGETTEYYFSSLYSKEAVMDCDIMIAEMLKKFNK